MLNCFHSDPIAIVTNKMAVIMEKCSILCAWSPAITRADKITILSVSYLDNLILCNSNLAFVILVNYIFYFDFKILSTKNLVFFVINTFIYNIRLSVHGESNAEYNDVNLIDMTLILPELYGLQIYKNAFTVNG